MLPSHGIPTKKREEAWGAVGGWGSKKLATVVLLMSHHTEGELLHILLLARGVEY